MAWELSFQGSEKKSFQPPKRQGIQIGKSGRSGETTPFVAIAKTEPLDSTTLSNNEKIRHTIAETGLPTRRQSSNPMDTSSSSCLA